MGAALVASGLAYAQRNSTCEDLPPERANLCWALLACAAIDDEARRLECFRSANEVHGAATAPAASEAPERTSAPVQTKERAEESATRAAPEAERRSGWRRLTRWPWRKRNDAPRADDAPSAAPEAKPTVVEQQVLATSYDIPDEFDAEVTLQRKLVRDRQLLVVDDLLLFETENAASSGINAGDTVTVTRATRMFGEKYHLVGKARRIVVGTRIRCEREDLGPDNQRKCRLLER